MSMTKRGPVICTYTGIEFDILNPTQGMIRIEDIAHALSNICRYVGQCQPFYSVSEHCCRMCDMVDDWKEWDNQDELHNAKFCALMHDSPETYMGDISTHLKRHFPGLVAIEDRLLVIIFGKYNIAWHPCVESLDKDIRRVEVLSLLPRGRQWWDFEDPEHWEKIVPWSPDMAEREFLRKFRELYHD